MRQFITGPVNEAVLNFENGIEYIKASEIHFEDFYAMLLSDVCLSSTSGLTREQRGLGRLKVAQR